MEVWCGGGVVFGERLLSSAILLHTSPQTPHIPTQTRERPSKQYTGSRFLGKSTDKTHLDPVNPVNPVIISIYKM